jgi:hypothetical protein
MSPFQELELVTRLLLYIPDYTFGLGEMDTERLGIIRYSVYLRKLCCCKTTNNERKTIQIYFMYASQVCCKDLWYLEVDKPPCPGKVQLVRAATNMLEVTWSPVAGADSYLLQVCKYDQHFKDSDLPLPSPSVQPSAKPFNTKAIPYIMGPSSSSQVPSPVSSYPKPIAGTPVATDTVPVPIPTPISVSTPTVNLSVSNIPAPSVATTVMMTSASNLATVSVSASSNQSPANLPAASSLISLPANMAGTASNALFAARSMTRTIAAPNSSMGRGIVRLRTPLNPTPTPVTTLRAPGGTPSIIRGSAATAQTASNLVGMNVSVKSFWDKWDSHCCLTPSYWLFCLLMNSK